MDHIIEGVGSFGKYQYRIVFIVGLVSALTSALIYATIFIAAEPELVCKRISSTNKTSLNATINLDYEENCAIWSSILENDTNNKNFNEIRRSNDNECYFDKTYYDNTIINEWNLICSRQFRAGLTQTVQILGSLFGCFSGYAGDAYGRRTALIIFALMLAIILTTSQFLMLDIMKLDIETKYIIFATSQFFIGFLVNCVYCTAYVLLMEITTERYRTSLANLNSYIYAIGELIVFVVYYFWRDWHILNWFLVAYSIILCLLLIVFIPESPVWLICMNRSEEAYAILRDIAKVNGIKNYVTPTTDMSAEERLLDDTKLLTKNNSQDDATKCSDDTKSEDFNWRMAKYLVIPFENLIKTSILLYIWAALMLIYYGISLGVLNIDLVDPYLMYILSVVAEIIGYTICYLNDYFGPKKMMTGFFLITTIAYSLIAFMTVDQSNTLANETSFSAKAIILMVLGLIGKCMISGIYNLTYIYTAELYTVNLRNTAIQILTSVGGVTSLISPQINMLKTLVWNPLPSIIYSIVAIIGAGIVWFLPDTRAIKQ